MYITNLFFFDGREDLARHRNGQGLFLPHAGFKTKGEIYVLFSITATYRLKIKNGLII